jgi:hypothetical protein
MMAAHQFLEQDQTTLREIESIHGHHLAVI